MTRAKLRAAMISVMLAALLVTVGTATVSVVVGPGQAPAIGYSAFLRDTPEPPSPWETAARLRVSVPGGQVIGSGTVIDSTAERSIILTCAHLFERPGQLAIDLFAPELDHAPGRTGQLHYLDTHRGRMVKIDRNADVAIVEFQPTRILASAPILPESEALAVGQKMTAIGCGHGEDATVWSTQIIALNVGRTGRSPLLSASWTECTTDPRQGRSGGGLYTLDGYVSGVCDFGTGQDSGLYASPSSIRAIVTKAGLTQIFGRKPCPPGQPCPSPQARPQGEPGFSGTPRKPAPPAIVKPPATTPDPAAPVVPFDLAGIEKKIPDEAPYAAIGAGIAALFYPRKKVA